LHQSGRFQIQDLEDDEETPTQDASVSAESSLDPFKLLDSLKAAIQALSEKNKKLKSENIRLFKENKFLKLSLTTSEENLAEERASRAGCESCGGAGQQTELLT